MIANVGLSKDTYDPVHATIYTTNAIFSIQYQCNDRYIDHRTSNIRKICYVVVTAEIASYSVNVKKVSRPYQH